MPFWWPVSPWVIDGITCSDGSQNFIPHGITNSRLFRSLCVIQLFLSWELRAVRMRSRALKHAGRVGWYETTGTVGLQLLPPQKEMSIKDGLSWRKWARHVWFCQSRVQKCETASENDSVTLFSHLKTFLFSSYFKNTSVWGIYTWKILVNSISFCKTWRSCDPAWFENVSRQSCFSVKVRTSDFVKLDLELMESCNFSVIKIYYLKCFKSIQHFHV